MSLSFRIHTHVSRLYNPCLFTLAFYKGCPWRMTKADLANVFHLRVGSVPAAAQSTLDLRQ